jgi:hypothetical protein
MASLATASHPDGRLMVDDRGRYALVIFKAERPNFASRTRPWEPTPSTAPPCSARAATTGRSGSTLRPLAADRGSAGRQRGRPSVFRRNSSRSVCTWGASMAWLVA